MSVADAVRGTDRAGRSGGSESRLSADDTIARAADALTLSLTGSLPSSVGRTTGGGMNDDEEEDGGGGGFLDEDDGDGDGDHDDAAKAYDGQIQESEPTAIGVNIRPRTRAYFESVDV